MCRVDIKEKVRETVQTNVHSKSEAMIMPRNYWHWKLKEDGMLGKYMLESSQYLRTAFSILKIKEEEDETLV